MTSIFFSVVAILGMTCLGLAAGMTYLNAQVEVKQSVTTNNNGQNTSVVACLSLTDCKGSELFLKLLGQTTSINQHCDGTPKACVSNLFMNLTGTPGTIKVTETGGGVSIHYCAVDPKAFARLPVVRCYDYKILANGTISEVR